MRNAFVTCPYCGTKYATFQPNCSNCGAALPMPDQSGALDLSAPPPAPPRVIANTYVWRLLIQDGWAITALVFFLIGIVFTPVGIGVGFNGLLAIMGIVFGGLGMLFTLVGFVILAWRIQTARAVVNVLRSGLSARGTITSVYQNYSVQINGRSPWVIKYAFAHDGQNFSGSVSTLDDPDENLAKGNAAWVLYLPGAPQTNSLYPHP